MIRKSARNKAVLPEKEQQPIKRLSRELKLLPRVTIKQTLPEASPGISINFPEQSKESDCN
jgi:hypothetical protein